MEAGIAPSSRKVYTLAWNRYTAFASQFRLPLSCIISEKVTLFVAFLSFQGLSVSTIESYLASLRHFRFLSDPSSPDPSLYTPYIKLLLRGIACTNTTKSTPRMRLPITPSLS